MDPVFRGQREPTALSESQPLVSVIIPCFNSRHTLPMALASLLAQTYPHWEAIIVDDGSTDAPAELAQAIGDPRFRVIRFDRNQGRGAARQRGNHEARGDLVAMLDADDWWYSTKLEKQVRFLLEHPDVELVSAGIIITDDEDQCVGCRCCDEIPDLVLNRLVHPPIAWAPVLMRARVAKRYSYNPRYRSSEDSDYLQRVCLKERFANLSDPLYVYREELDYNWKKATRRLKYRIHALSLLWPQFPYQATREIIFYLAKFASYAGASVLGQHPRLILRRSLLPTPELLELHEKEKHRIRATANHIAGGS